MWFVNYGLSGNLWKPPETGFEKKFRNLPETARPVFGGFHYQDIYLIKIFQNQTLKVKIPHILTTCHRSISKDTKIFFELNHSLAKTIYILANFVYQDLKLHNRYCHNQHVY